MKGMKEGENRRFQAVGPGRSGYRRFALYKPVSERRLALRQDKITGPAQMLPKEMEHCGVRTHDPQTFRGSKWPGRQCNSATRGTTWVKRQRK